MFTDITFQWDQTFHHVGIGFKNLLWIFSFWDYMHLFLWYKAWKWRNIHYILVVMCVGSSVALLMYPGTLKHGGLLIFLSFPWCKWMYNVNGCSLSYRKRIILARVDYNSVENGLNIIMPSKITHIHRTS